MPWPRLKCCDSHDYCNADRHANASTWTGDNERPDPEEHALNYTGSFNRTSPSRDVMGSIQPDPGPIAGGRESPDQFPENRVKPLHVAALVLAIAALISVLAACYVVTRSGKFYFNFAPTESRARSCLCEKRRKRENSCRLREGNAYR
ncbi:hypothetical protein WN51_04341 [Melipona quadrifasciata]|uniref:Uncharacterized protein n=1 Tax=Melipona quadrifasciata TaxID=166423 RepID=A0A0N0BCP3_9HYME|nr:hypothetical protein WN51_04341 [Melipona quadrifasciata]